MVGLEAVVLQHLELEFIPIFGTRYELKIPQVHQHSSNVDNVLSMM
jgi:hypothetical protein